MNTVSSKPVYIPVNRNPKPSLSKETETSLQSSTILHRYKPYYVSAVSSDDGPSRDPTGPSTVSCVCVSMCVRVYVRVFGFCVFLFVHMCVCVGY